MAPVVAGIRPEYEDDIAFRLYDVGSAGEGSDLADSFSVQYVPTFVFVSADGEVVDTIIGEVPADELRRALDQLK